MQRKEKAQKTLDPLLDSRLRSLEHNKGIDVSKPIQTQTPYLVSLQ